MKVSNSTNSFLKECFDCSHKLMEAGSNKSNWYTLPYVVFTKKRVTRSSFNAVLKDPIWQKTNNEHDYIYSHAKNFEDLELKDKLRYGYRVINLMFNVDHEYVEDIVKHGHGSLLIKAMRVCEDDNLRIMSLRAIKSDNYRVRREGVKHCPVSSLNKMINDPRKEVRGAVIKRLGMHNIANKLLKDPAVDIRLNAALVLNRLDIIEEVLEKETDKVQAAMFKPSMNTQFRLMKMIAKLPKKKVLFNIDAKDAGYFVGKMVEAKLSSE